MSLISNIDNIAFSSNFNYDKILGPPLLGSFSVSASAFPGSLGNIASSTAAHGFGANTLPVMMWSTNNLDWYEAGARDYTAGGTLDPRFTATVAVSSTQYQIIAQNFTGGALTCYWKMVLIDG